MVEELLQAIDQHRARNGLTMTEILALPGPLCSLARRMMRRRTSSLAEIAADLELPPAEAGRVVERLLARGMIAVAGPPVDPPVAAAAGPSAGPPDDPAASGACYRLVLVHTRHRERIDTGNS